KSGRRPPSGAMACSTADSAQWARSVPTARPSPNRVVRTSAGGDMAVHLHVVVVNFIVALRSGFVHACYAASTITGTPGAVEIRSTGTGGGHCPAVPTPELAAVSDDQQGGW